MLGLHLVEVPVGTEFVVEGEKLIVDGQNCVQVGDTLYVAPQTNAAIHARVLARHPATNIGE